MYLHENILPIILQIPLNNVILHHERIIPYYNIGKKEKILYQKSEY